MGEFPGDLQQGQAIDNQSDIQWSEDQKFCSLQAKALVQEEWRNSSGSNLGASGNFPFSMQPELIKD